MRKKIATNVEHQLGQTLIETLVAIFILVMGIASALTLAIYSFQGVSDSSKLVLGTSLSRQQVEALRNVRDGNWIDPSDPLTDCSAIYGGTPNSQTQACRQGWIGSGARALNPGSYAPQFNAVNANWTLASVPFNSGDPNTYNLKFDSATNLYTTGGSTPSIYYGKVDITWNTAPPFDKSNNPQIVVKSTVWWTSRKCPLTSDPTSLPASCFVKLEQHLTNWRDF